MVTQQIVSTARLVGGPIQANNLALEACLGGLKRPICSRGVAPAQLGKELAHRLHKCSCGRQGGCGLLLVAVVGGQVASQAHGMLLRPHHGATLHHSGEQRSQVLVGNAAAAQLSRAMALAHACSSKPATKQQHPPACLRIQVQQQAAAAGAGQQQRHGVHAQRVVATRQREQQIIAGRQRGSWRRRRHV